MNGIVIEASGISTADDYFKSVVREVLDYLRRDGKEVTKKELTFQSVETPIGDTDTVVVQCYPGTDFRLVMPIVNAIEALDRKWRIHLHGGKKA